jgi:hypothetical protein
MVEGFFALTGGLDQDGEIFFDLMLSDQVAEHLRAQGVIDAVVGFGFRVEGAVIGIGHGANYT